MKPHTLLLTGFEAFADDPGGTGLNPSAAVVLALQGQQMAQHRVLGAVLPCEYEAAVAVLEALIEQHRPQLVVCLGQAGGRAAISIERVALKLDDAVLTDNAGVQRCDLPVLPGTPAAYFATLPIKAMLAAVQGAGMACELSNSAGGFVCNHVFYRLMHRLAGPSTPPTVRGGFIHLPYLPEQAAARGAASMTLDDMVSGVRLALDVAAQAAPKFS